MALPQRNTKLAIFIMPTIFLYMIFMTLTILPWYTGMILAMAEFFGMHHVYHFLRFVCLDINITFQIVTRVLLNKSTTTESVTMSPYFSGIIFASMVWVAFAWVSKLMQRGFPLSLDRSVTKILHLETDSHAFAHLIFALSFGLCVYNFFRAMTLDPGTCPTPTSDAELKSVRNSTSRVVLIPDLCSFRLLRIWPPKGDSMGRRSASSVW